MPAPSIYCVLCPSFHGATLLSLVLGNHSRIFALGDTIPANPSHHCGCGALVSDCEFWRQVGAVMPRPELLALPALNQAAVIASSVAAFRLGKTIRFEPFAQGVEHQLAVCRTFADWEIFIDGFKSVSRYSALKAAGFPVHGVLHLVRDPRSFAASSKRKAVPVAEAASQWSTMHKTIARVTRLMGERVFKLRYEDLCVAPEEHLRRIQSWMGLQPEPLQHPFPPGRHWVGNRSIRAFDGTIALRESWRETFDAEELAEIEKACGRQSRKLGYDLFS
jgi:Sulfotransferase family